MTKEQETLVLRDGRLVRCTSAYLGFVQSKLKSGAT